jgi:hypothetical protein
MGKSLEHVNCKVKKETAAPAAPRPRRRYGPKVRIDGGCYAMYTRNPSWGGRNPQGKNLRRMLCDEPVVGGRNPLKKKVREIGYILEY